MRAEIERELGDVITRSMAARLLGVHHSSLQRWIDSEDLPLVMSKLLTLMEVDMYPLADPDRGDDIDGALGDGSAFEYTNGYFAHAVGPSGEGASGLDGPARPDRR